MGYVADLIEKGFALPLGYEQGTTRNHYLFYSIDDRDCYVAVTDDSNKEVVTVLPVQWHNAWRISPEAEMMAKDLAINRENSRYLKPDIKSGNPDKALVSCLITKLNGEPKGPIGLGKFLIDDLEHLHSLTGINTDDSYRPAILGSLQEKLNIHTKPGETVKAITWTVGDQEYTLDPSVVGLG